MWRPAALIFWLLATAGTALADNAAGILDAARLSYYSLRREGLASFTCDAVPNWDTVLIGQRRLDPVAADKAYDILRAVAFSVEIAPGRRPKVTHSDLPANDDDNIDAVKQIVAGIQEAVGGFFDTWSPFVLTSPVPPSKAELVEVHDLWTVDYREGAVRIRLVIRKDYVISVMQITTPAFESTIQPLFTKSASGLLLSAVQGEYNPIPAGTSASLQMRIEYQEVDGFALPARLAFSSNDGRALVMMDLAFGNCQVSRR